MGAEDKKQQDQETETTAGQEEVKANGGMTDMEIQGRGLERFREAHLMLDEALRLDPAHPGLKARMEEATQGILRDLLLGKLKSLMGCNAGKGKETLALPAPIPVQRITYHAHAAPLHKLRTEDMLPLHLLTPFQAERDHETRDVYNYLTVQTDIRMPKRQLSFLQDRQRHQQYERAIVAAVDHIKSLDLDPRLLHVGAGAGLYTMMALRAGAHHVTAVERWLYLASSCNEVLQANGFPLERYKVLYKRPTDLALGTDVPVCCNILLCDMIDEGLLSSGLIPVVRHCVQKLMADDMVVIPMAATVYVQAVQARTGKVCGFDMTPINLHRWHPAYTAESSARKTLDVTFTCDGIWNAVVFWFKLKLAEGIEISTAPCQAPAGELRVDATTVLPLLASHNTVRMRFDVEQAEYLHLAKADASFPTSHFSMLADTRRNKVDPVFT
eukprot:jgi/Botrbrau1/16294/Bobra.0066s0063.1